MQNDQGMYGIPRRQDPCRGYIFVSGGSGHGSTNTKVRKYTSVKESFGPDAPIYNADTQATNGTELTIVSDGIYIVAANDLLATGATLAITINDKTLSTNPGSMSYTNGLRTWSQSAGSGPIYITWTGFLKAGDIIRIKDNGGNDNTGTDVNFAITKISN